MQNKDTRRQNVTKSWKHNKYRILFVGAFLMLGYSLLTAKLWLEQIRQTGEHLKKISKQSIRRIRIPAPRGKIFTSDLHLLADNEPAYDAFLYFEEMRQPGNRKKTINYINNAIKQIAQSTGRKNIISPKKVIEHMNLRPGLPFPVFQELSPLETARVFELSGKINGLAVIPRNCRIYPAGSTAAHLIGYTRPENPQKAIDRDEFFYYIPDPQGKRGLERVFDEVNFAGHKIRGLKGTPGYSLVQVDHRGFVHKTLIEEIKPLAGNNIVLNLNWKAQILAEDILHGKRGAFVLLNADSGSVLAMASSPSFDLREFSPKISYQQYQKLLKDPANPLLNRALSGSYTPGSILKPLIGLAFLENNISPDERVFCDGASKIGNTKVRCSSWRKGGHGSLDLRGALEHSCNDYFIENGCMLGFDKILPVLRSAGIGRKTGFELPERHGLLPNKVYKYRNYGFHWNKYDTGLLSIGQGIILVTPLQAAVYCAALANGGTIYRPFLLREIRDSHGTVLYKSDSKPVGKLAASPESLEIVKEGMYRVVNSPVGSGNQAKNDVITLYGKTGTAEIGTRKNRRKNTWFICHGTYQGKTYAAALIIEDGASGGKTCAPLARDFFIRWLKK
jgi:penicillin-binding protein 2